MAREQHSDSQCVRVVWRGPGVLAQAVVEDAWHSASAECVRSVCDIPRQCYTCRLAGKWHGGKSECILTDVPSNTARAPEGHQHADLATSYRVRRALEIERQRANMTMKAGEGASALDRG